MPIYEPMEEPRGQGVQQRCVYALHGSTEIAVQHASFVYTSKSIKVAAD